MSWANERQQIEARFDTWTATPVKKENVPFNEPSTEFIAVYIRNGNSTKASLGSTPQLRRSTGVVIVQVFGIENTGTHRIRGYADQVAAIFRDAQITVSVTEQISFWEPYILTVPATNGRPQINVEAPFERDEIL